MTLWFTLVLLFLDSTINFWLHHSLKVIFSLNKSAHMMCQVLYQELDMILRLKYSSTSKEPIHSKSCSSHFGTLYLYMLHTFYLTHFSHSLALGKSVYNNNIIWEFFIYRELYIFSATCSSHLICLRSISLSVLSLYMSSLYNSYRVFPNIDVPSRIWPFTYWQMLNCLYFLLLQLVPRWIPK